MAKQAKKKTTPIVVLSSAKGPTRGPRIIRTLGDFLNPSMESNTDTISDVIRDRIARDKGAKGRKPQRRMFANDNISQHLHLGDIERLQSELTDRIESVLDTLLIDRRNDHNSKGTASRVAKMLLRETMAGRYEPMPSITEFPNASNLDQLYHVGNINVRSMCSHHLVPIYGTAHIGVFPGKNVLGLSKFQRLTDWVMSRPQIQEESTTMLADIIEQQMKPEGLAVLVKCKHLCCSQRGVKNNDMVMTTSVMRGVLRDNNHIRSEFFQLIAIPE